MVMNTALIDTDLGSFGGAIPDYAEFDNKDRKILDGTGTNFFGTIEMQQGTSASNDEAGPVRIKPMTIPFRGIITNIRFSFHGTIPPLMALVAIRNTDTGKVITKILGPGNNAVVFPLNEYFSTNLS